MKKIFGLFLILGALLGISGCNKKSESQSGKINVVATIFPVWDWARNVTENCENVNLELLVKNGVDLHSFQPTAGDIIKISTCDVLIYIGGESDKWVKDALKNAVNKKMVVINLMEMFSESVKVQEVVEGMQGEAEEEPEYDEHVWLSLLNAKLSCEKIAEVLSELDSSEKEKLEANLADYEKEIEGVRAFNASKDRKLLVVCDRFPFRYMTVELGALYYAAFAGCSAETEASFETVAFLSKIVKKFDQHRVYVTESSDKKMAETVIKNADYQPSECEIVVLDSMQSTTLEQALAGKNYIDVMKENYGKIK